MACEWLAYRSPDLLTTQRSSVRNDSESPMLRAQVPCSEQTVAVTVAQSVATEPCATSGSESWRRFLTRFRHRVCIAAAGWPAVMRVAGSP
jgi:hypothetical protein